MDHVDHHLSTSATDSALKPCIKGALAIGKRLLNKYYSLTDHSELYRIAMGMYFDFDFVPLLTNND